MTYEEVRQYCVRWGNMHPDTKGSVSDIVEAMNRDFTYPQRGLLLMMAAHIDDKQSETQSDQSMQDRR